MTARLATWSAAAAVPLGVLAAVLVLPEADVRWENHPAHFWIVLGAAAVSVALAWSVLNSARRRRDARLFLVSLAFAAAASFLGLHALATPGVLVGKNAGFELATPVGLVAAAAFAAASSLELGANGSRRVMRLAPWLIVALAALVVAWAAVSLAETWPLSTPLAGEQLDGWQVSLAVLGVALFAAAALGYLRLYRRRRTRFLLAVVLAFALFAEAMLAVAWARNWRLSWWEWHLLMLGAFAVIALAARVEWHEERFSALYLDQTLAGARDVSVLFADLQGFTSYAERRAPGEVAAMLNAYFERLIPLLEEAGGEVHQIVGDEIMAIFNKQGDQPEHVRHAAGAALQLQATAGDIAAKHPDWPRFRVGVNSGDVHAGVVGAARGHRKHGIVGDTVNLAARLETRAPAGKVVVGGETARRLGNGTVLERLPDAYVKGKSEPVEAYLLHALGR
jgi:adenylate cyclase